LPFIVVKKGNAAHLTCAGSAGRRRQTERLEQGRTRRRRSRPKRLERCRVRERHHPTGGGPYDRAAPRGGAWRTWESGV